MIDAAGGAGGGLLAMCLFIVAPIALLLHFGVRRFFLVAFLTALVFTLFMLGLWIYFDAFVPGRRWSSFPLVWMGFIVSFIVSLVAGVPAILFRWISKRGKKGEHDVAA
ncbi:MAG: hypothetical protein ACTHKU_05730 [Verrucomicrobiota bacterium]